MQSSSSLAGSKIRPDGLFTGPNVRLLGSCWVQHEWPNSKGIYLLPGPMLGPERNAEPDTGTVQSCAVAVAVPRFRENFAISNPIVRLMQ